MLLNVHYRQTAALGIPLLWEIPIIFSATRPIKGWSDVRCSRFPLGAAQQVKVGDLRVCVDVLAVTAHASSGSLGRDFPSRSWSGSVA